MQNTLSKLEGDELMKQFTDIDKKARTALAVMKKVYDNVPGTRTFIGEAYSKECCK